MNSVCDSVTSILETMGIETLDNLPTRFDHSGRTYRVNSSEIRDWAGEPIGNALIIRDISQLVTREQRLAVLNRLFFDTTSATK